METKKLVKLGTGPAVALAAVGLSLLRWNSIAPEGPAPAVAASVTAPVYGIRAEGRLVAYPDAEVSLASETGGRILRFPVREKDSVRKGDLIAEIDGAEQRASLVEARAHASEAAADVKFFKQELDRTKSLVASRTVPESSLDKAERDYDTAKARETLARATVSRLEATVAKLEIRSPIDGVVISRDADAGETVGPGARVATVADLKRTRIEAEVDEFDAGKITLGGMATITAEGFPDQFWTGKIEEIPDTVVGRRLKPQDPGKPSDTRVLIVKIALSGQTPVKLGQRVEVELNTEPARTPPGARNN